MRASPESLPDNETVISFLSARTKSTVSDGIGTQPAWRAASLHTHPDILERLDRLGTALGIRERDIVAGRPVLVDPKTGLIIAAGLGTTYLIRVRNGGDTDLARYPRVRTMSKGEVFSLDPLPDEWRFGIWKDDEFSLLSPG